MDHLYLGTARAVITPPLGVTLSGYGFRDRGCDAVLDDLELRVFWFQSDDSDSPEQAACIITGDLIGFGSELTAYLRENLSERHGIAPQAVLLAASHTHSGPQTCYNMSPAGGDPDPTYMATLKEKTIEAVECARGRLDAVRLSTGYGSLSGYAINRRVLKNGVAVAAPNPKGVRDDQVTVVTAHKADDGSLRAVLFHYTCHPTTMGSYTVTGDYPGAARRRAESELEGADCGFLPGCFGDVRPACTVIGGERFRRGTPQDVTAFGDALGLEVARVAHALEHAPAARHDPALAGEACNLELPLVDEPLTATLSLQRLDLGEDLSLVALGGEICVDYGHAIKRMRPAKVTIPVGYSNGMVGYIPSERMFPEGGYEPDTSIKAFDLPSPFQPQIEGIILDAVKSLFA